MNEQLFVDPNLDLTFTRKVNVDHRSIWRAWTEPALLKQWFLSTAMENCSLRN